MLGIECAHWRHGESRLFDIARSNMRAGLKPLHGPDKIYRAFSDFAGQYFFKVIDQHYPGSKFILTTRDLEGWFQSRERKVQKNLRTPGYRYGFTFVDRGKWTAEWHRVHRETSLYFKDRPQDFLMINIPAGEGWASLCSFLEVPVPSEPFPFLNKLKD